MTAYYNEIDPYAAQWLRNLIKAGHIAPGYVDERSIVDVRSDDLRGYRQCHFFAGIGVWSYALRRAGWPDDLAVWTGSCPCQPFSQAGGRGGFDDERHLWPHFSRLIVERKPDVVFGEQVSDRNGLAWLDFVCADLEAASYAVGALDTCSAGAGAPHIRQRLYWVAEPDSEGRSGRAPRREKVLPEHPREIRALADVPGERRREARSEHRAGPEEWVDNRSESDSLAAPESLQLAGRAQPGFDTPEVCGTGANFAAPAGRGCGPVNGYWFAADWVLCRDPDGAKWRPVEPGTFPLAHGAPARVGRLRAYGNAINAEAARHFIESYMSRLELAPVHPLGAIE